MTHQARQFLRTAALAAAFVSFAAAQGVDSIVLNACPKVAADPQGNLLAAQPYSPTNDILRDYVWGVFRYDPEGTLLGTLPGTITGNAGAAFLVADPHGGVYLGGSAFTGALLLSRVSDPNSPQQWTTPLTGDSLRLIAADFDPQDNLIVMGQYPAAPANKVRIVKLDKRSGAILAEYRFGGSGTAPYAMAADHAGAVYIAGFDEAGAYAMKLDAALQNVVYTTHLKGSDPSMAYDVAPAPDGGAFVAGVVLLFGAPDVFPTTAGAFQTAPVSPRAPFTASPLVPSQSVGFIARLDASGALKAATLLGGSNSDTVVNIRSDAAGSPTVIGYTASADFPATGASRTPCGPRNTGTLFVTKLDALLTRVQSSALLPQRTLASASGLLADNSFYLSLQPYDEPSRVLRISPDAPSSPVACVVNGANYLLDRGLAPGQLITIFGQGLGPEALIAPDKSQQLPFSAGGTSVRIGGFPAALLAVDATQINAIVPFEITGLDQRQPAAIEISRNGRVIYTWPKFLGGGPAVPLLHFDSAGSLDLAAGSTTPLADVINADGTRNSAANPAPAGSDIAIYATGFGVLSNNPTDGAPGSADFVQYPAAFPPTFSFPVVRDIPVVTPYGSLTLPPPTPITTMPGRTNAVLRVRAQIPLNFPSGQVLFQIGPLQDGSSDWSGFFYVK